MGLTEAYFVYNTYGWIYRLRRVPSRSRGIAMYIGETHTIHSNCVAHAVRRSLNTRPVYTNIAVIICNISKTKNIIILSSDSDGQT